jgi:hypothetical protein
MKKSELRKLIREVIKEQYTGGSVSVLCGALCSGPNYGTSTAYGFSTSTQSSYVNPYIDQLVTTNSLEAQAWINTYDTNWLFAYDDNEFILLPPYSVPVCSQIFGDNFEGPQAGTLSSPCFFMNSYGDACDNAPASCWEDYVEPDEPVFNENMSCDEMQASGVPGSGFPEMFGYNQAQYQGDQLMGTGLDSTFCQICNDPEWGDGQNYYTFNANIYLGPMCSACCNTNYTGPYSYVDDPDYDPSIYGSPQTPLALPVGLNKPTKPGKPDKQKARMQKLSGLKKSK